MAKYPKHTNERLFKEFERYGKHFQSNEDLIRRNHPYYFD